MHLASKRWRSEKGRSSKRKAQLNLNREKSRRKVEHSLPSKEQTVDQPPVDYSTGKFLLVHVSVWPKLFENIKCSECGEQKLSAEFSDVIGLSSKITLKCVSCGSVAGESHSSPRTETKPRAPYLVNQRIVNSINSVGLGFAALERLCASMNMDCLSKNAFHLLLKAQHKEASALKNVVLQTAHKQVHEAHNNLSTSDYCDIAVSYDGTWHRRGYQSLHGIGIAIDILTGLVVDFEVLSKFCLSCSIAAASFQPNSEEFIEWEANHNFSGECEINFTGSSGAMEVKAAEIIWKRSTDYGLRYTTMLSDGDSKTWTTLKDMAPYGDNVKIEKEECINHVSKRLGKALREVAKKKKLGGKTQGALTGTVITRLNSYYRKAIVSHLNDIGGMKKEIFASLSHCGSTDRAPDHTKCPVGVHSWCFYNRAVAQGNRPPSHSTMSVQLSASVIKCILPVYERLTDDQLLLRCSRIRTQNANESLHSSIWRKCPKEVFVSRKRIETAVVNAVSEYNNGLVKTQLMKHALTIGEVHPSTSRFAEQRDTIRELRQSEAATSERKAIRIKKKYGQLQNKKKDSFYEPGGF